MIVTTAANSNTIAITTVGSSDIAPNTNPTISNINKKTIAIAAIDAING